MRTPGSIPATPDTRGMQVACGCGATLTTLQPGEAVVRHPAGAAVRRITCPGCQKNRRIYVRMQTR